MRRNTIINLGFILANIALLVLVQFPHGLSAIEAVTIAHEPGLPPTLIGSNPPGLNEVVVPLQPRPQREDPEPVVEEPAEPPADEEQGEEITMESSQPLAAVYRRLPTKDKVIALTFDDGPKESVRELLAILQEKGVPATFFVLGGNARNRPDLVQAIVDSGCEIANHSWSHPYLTDIAQDKIVWQVENSAAAFAAMGAESQPYLRPPYGKWDNRVLEVCAALGHKVVLWDVDSRDWEYNNPKIVLKRALAGLKPGSIVLFHDGPKVTIKVLPDFIDAARAQGYQFVLISDYIE